jgi:orotidine-5'-phosphate decarboxylase
MSTDQPELYVALDLPRNESLAMAEQLIGIVDGVKVGSTLFCQSGPEVVAALQGQGHQIFLDLKFHDIPHQVGLACERLVGLGVTLITIHTAGGDEMMRAAVSATQGSGTRVVGVTVLTSMDERALAQVGVNGAVESLVLQRAAAAQAAGLSGVVASAREVEAIRAQIGEGFEIVTPGIRMTGDAVGDQVRVVTPTMAVASGATSLVVGRPITNASDPVASANLYMEAIRGAV